VACRSPTATPWSARWAPAAARASRTRTRCGRRSILRLSDQWVWDSWIADDGERFHLFFLQAPRALEDLDLRHAAARIGHATSSDLRDWEYHGVALAPGEDEAFWTGSVVRGDDGVWRMFHTTIHPSRGLPYQHIGMAESADLFSWERVGGALVEPDPRWYQTSEAWRDPFVYRDGDGWSMLITARVPDRPRLRDGVLAHARSRDLRTWELGPPITAPAGFGQLEVAQLREVDGETKLVFTCAPDEQAEPEPYCTWIADPWDIANARPFTPEPRLFAAPLVQGRDGRWVFIGFRDPVLELIDPVALR
jgi:beta-fructofuranosidase